MSIPTALLGIRTHAIKITSQERFKELRSVILNHNPGFASLEDPKMDFPALYVIVYEHNLKTVTFQKVEEGLVV